MELALTRWVAISELHKSLHGSCCNVCAWLYRQNSLVKISVASGREVEVDETFIGGAARFMNPERRKRMITVRGVKDKTAVLGILDRGGEVRATVVRSRQKEYLQGRFALTSSRGAKSRPMHFSLIRDWVFKATCTRLLTMPKNMWTERFIPTA